MNASSNAESSSETTTEVEVKVHFPQSRRSFRRLLLASGLACLGALWILIPAEWAHWQYTFSQPQALVAWMAAFNSDTSLYALWLLLLPFAYLCRVHLLDPQGTVAQSVEFWLQAGSYQPQSDSADESRSSSAIRSAQDPLWLSWTLAVVLGLLGMGNVLSVGTSFSGLPPAYHDEYSYLFQAETFLRGRVSNDRWEAAPELFDQVHVLNDSPGHFASRYFPGAGLWLTPFVAAGAPYLGYAVAQTLICAGVFWIGRDLSGNGVGLLAGLLCTLMPGVALFGNLLLAHHPTLVGLVLFWSQFHRWAVGKQLRHACLASGGLAFAMWCRPMTAFAIGLPYGIYFFWQLFRSRQSLQERSLQVFAMGGPLLGGLLLLLPLNAAVTGDLWTSPYQKYTQLHTPRHMFGFYNRSRGEAWIAQQAAAGHELPVHEHYDEWAQELTPALSWENARYRVLASGLWTLGILPACVGVLFFLGIGQADRPLWWLVFAALVSLHLVHLAYWYDGIMHWHYVFESAPLLGLIFARSTQLIAYQCRRFDRQWITIWWLGLPLLGFLTAYTTLEPFWNSTLSAGISEVKFARERHAEVTTLLKQQVSSPAVVFIRQDPSDRHLDYVVNDPALQAPILRAHWLPEQYSVSQLENLFPDRSLYLLDLVEQKLIPLSTTPVNPARQE